MDIVGISNLFNIVSAAHCEICSYHAGWLSDITLNVSNVYNKYGNKGTLFPHMQFIFPIDGRLDISEQHHKQVMKVELRLYDTMEFRGVDVVSDDNPVVPIDKVSNPTTETLIERWRRLNRIMVEFIAEVRRRQKYDATFGGMRFGMPLGEIEYFTDSNYGPHKLIYFGVRFEVEWGASCDTGCINYEVIPVGWPTPSTMVPPDPFGTTDLEDDTYAEDTEPIDTNP